MVYLFIATKITYKIIIPLQQKFLDYVVLNVLPGNWLPGINPFKFIPVWNYALPYDIAQYGEIPKKQV